MIAETAPGERGCGGCGGWGGWPAQAWPAREWPTRGEDAAGLRRLLTVALRQGRQVTLRWATAGGETVASGVVARLMAAAVRLETRERGALVVALDRVRQARLEAPWDDGS